MRRAQKRIVLLHCCLSSKWSFSKAFAFFAKDRRLLGVVTELAGCMPSWFSKSFFLIDFPLTWRFGKKKKIMVKHEKVEEEGACHIHHKPFYLPRIKSHLFTKKINKSCLLQQKVICLHF